MSVWVLDTGIADSAHGCFLSVFLQVRLIVDSPPSPPQKKKKKKYLFNPKQSWLPTFWKKEKKKNKKNPKHTRDLAERIRILTILNMLLTHVVK